MTPADDIKRLQEAEERGFVQGMAVAVANAVRQETWYADQLLGGVTIADMQRADVEDYDIEPIRRALLDRGANKQARRIKTRTALAKGE